MRSYDMTMPEELNRVLCDHASALLLCSSAAAAANLRATRRSPARVEVVGDVMVDVALAVQPRARERLDLVRRPGMEPGEYLLATAHRAGNVDTAARLGELVELLVHDRRAGAAPAAPADRGAAGRVRAARAARAARQSVTICEPLGYVELTALLCNARAALTDSGGLQKEAYLARVPCITMRDAHRVDRDGADRLEHARRARRAARRGRRSRAPIPVTHPALYGDGDAGERVLAALEAFES